MKIDLKSLTIKLAHDALLKKEFSARELAEAYLAEIEKKNKDLNAYLEVFDDVLEQAKEADEKIAELGNLQTSKLPDLLGIPLAVKDNILIKGHRCGAASKILEGYCATYDSTVVKKLKDAGVVFLGRTNMDEFAMGGSTENSAYGPTMNPHDASRVPGGSSGGSAAAVAADLALATLGSDTGGSIRQPASFCGLVGLKPTYGAVSRYGLMAMGSSLDQIGPLAKTVEDAEIIFDAIRGKDSKDGTSIDIAAHHDGSGKESKKNKRLVIGVPRAFTDAKGVDRAVSDNFEKSLKALKEVGCEIRDIEMPSLHCSLAAYYVIMSAEASSNLARFDGVRYGLREDGENLLDDYLKTRGRGFGREVRRRIILGTYVLSAGYYDAYYNKAIKARGLITGDFNLVFKGGVDVIATPTSPVPAFKIGEKSNDPLSMYLADVFTVAANIAGVPAISVPSGFTEISGKKLPLGIQFQAPKSREDILFETGRIFERI